MGRPPIQHHKVVHTIALSPETEEVLDRVLDRWTINRVIGAGGEIIEGATSHPLGYLGVVGAVIIALHTIPGIRELVVKFEKELADSANEATETFLKNLWGGTTPTAEANFDAWERWRNNLWDSLRGLFD